MINGFAALLSSGPRGFRRYISYILLLNIINITELFLGQKGRASFQHFKKAWHHEKGAGRRALQKRPLSQNTV